jgi:hypothetical protein
MHFFESIKLVGEGGEICHLTRLGIKVSTEVAYRVLVLLDLIEKGSFLVLPRKQLFKVSPDFVVFFLNQSFLPLVGCFLLLREELI